MNEKAESRTEITGGCVCGGTRYVLTSAPFSLGDCHCIDCRRSAGAPYVTWGSVRREDLVVTRGEPRKVAHANRIRSFAVKICVMASTPHTTASVAKTLQ